MVHGSPTDTKNAGRSADLRWLKLLTKSTLFCLALIIEGCVSSENRHAETAAPLLKAGYATIENFHSGANIGFGLVERRYTVTVIDGKFVAEGRVTGVYPLSPGHHVVTIDAAYTHITGLTSIRSIDSGQVDIPLDVTAGERCVIGGEELARITAKLWISSMPDHVRVTKPMEFSVNTTVQEQPPVFIPIIVR